MASITGSSRTRGVRTRNRRTALIAVGITLFLVVDIALVLWAVSANRPDPSAQPAPIPTFGMLDGPSPSPTPTATTPAVAAAPRFLTVASGDVAWRSTAGACPSPGATVEATTDRGATWTAITVPGARRVLGLEGVDASQLRVVSASDDACAVTLSESFTGGQFFERYPDRLSATAYIDAVDAAVVHVNGAVSTAPCPVLQLASTDQATGAVCADELVQLAAGATTWDRASVPGLLSAAPREGGGYTLARAGAEGCEGIAIESIAGSIAQSQPVRIGCVAETAPSEVTLASRGASVWLWSGTTTRVSPDGGATWS